MSEEDQNIVGLKSERAKRIELEKLPANRQVKTQNQKKTIFNKIGGALLAPQKIKTLDGVIYHWGESFSEKFVTDIHPARQEIGLAETSFYRIIKLRYKTKLSRIWFVYKMVTFVARLLSYFFRLRYILFSRNHPIVSQTKFLSTHQKSKVILLGPTNYSSAKPAIYPFRYRKKLSHIITDFFAPEVFITNMGRCFGIGASNLITNGKLAVVHDTFDVLTCLTSEEMHNRISIFPKSRMLRFNVSFKNHTHFTQAANFLDATATNYAHWLTEILPKVAVFSKLGRLSGTPILIDDGLHPNFLEALHAIIGENHPIIIVPPNHTVLCENLLLVSVVGYSCFGLRETHVASNYPKYQTFNKLAFDILREIGISHSKKIKKTFPKNIYLRRGSTSRSLENEREILSELKNHGFAVIDVHELTFAEQVKLFNTAKNIVAPTGAILANMLFSTQRTNIVILFPYSKIANYGYWPNIAALNKVNISYVLGEPSQQYLEYHSNYSVDVFDILRAL